MSFLYSLLRRSVSVAIFSLCIAVYADSDPDLKFELLKIDTPAGTHLLTNAVVTSRTKENVFIVHAGGMTSFKVAKLPEEVRQQLGYEVAKPTTNAVAALAQKSLASFKTENVRKIEDQVRAQLPMAFKPGKLPVALLAGIAGGFLLIHLFFSYCLYLICVKTANPPGVLVWIPLLQLIPMLRAAGMSPLWFVAYLIPVINIVAQIVWSFKIAEARNKSAVVAILLILPVTNIFAFLYLAFSGGSKPADKKEPKKPEIMTLEAA